MLYFLQEFDKKSSEIDPNAVTGKVHLLNRRIAFLATPRYLFIHGLALGGDVGIWLEPRGFEDL